MRVHFLLGLALLICSDAASSDRYLVVRAPPASLAVRHLDADLFRALDRDDMLTEAMGSPQALAWRELSATSTHRPDNFLAPYFSMVQKSRHRGVSIELGEHRRLRLGAMSEGYGYTEVLPVVSPFARRTMASVELEQRRGKFAAIATIGLLRESGSRLSNAQGNSLSSNHSARTWFSALSMAYALDPNVSLVAMAAAGRTTGYSYTNLLEGERGPVHTASMSVGLSARRLWHDSDRVGLTFTIPTHVSAGATSVAAPSLVREDGTLSFSSRMLTLAPRSSERNLELSYTRQFDSNARLAASMMLRVDAGGNNRAGNEVLLGIRYGRRF